MDVEIVFSGLCVFNNVRNKPELEHEPSVTLVRTDGVASRDIASGAVAASGPTSDRVAAAIEDRWNRSRAEIDRGHFEAMQQEIVATLEARGKQKDWGGVAPIVEEGPADGAADGGGSEVHIPYLAFNSVKTTVNDRSGFVDVKDASGFLMLPLNGIELVVKSNPAGTPTVHSSFDLVVKRDEYWPAARGQWNREVVPLRGKRPTKSAAVGFMRFGAGLLSSGRLAPNAWQFDRPGLSPLVGVFAEEVIYSRFPHDKDDIVIELLDIESGARVRDPLRFSARRGETLIRLFIGNNDSNDVDLAVTQTRTIGMSNTNHFRFLNRSSLQNGLGVIPTVIADANPLPILDRPVGSYSSGPCGPITSNG